ncbi:hypothetical protein K443DRAFT_3510 [Laccaria amethystina LaAM-08-1]|uniref:Uncharacterized protein n=1 Tax=Laccaria amethystina LaAM-08-1 TaxID=1095629 RepID=A0A0C9Y706_9AGAR|nr:hypothetical protein K443DRAFT_3510 [Laccaria amethystina LaAM-08-1]
MPQGIGIAVFPTDGRSLTDIEGVKNIHFECIYQFRLTLIDEGPMPILAAIFPGPLRRALPPVTMMTKMMTHGTLPRLPKGKDASSFRCMYPNYVSNVAPTSPLDALGIPAWSHVWLEEIHPFGTAIVGIMGSWSLDAAKEFIGALVQGGGQAMTISRH